MIAGLFPGLLDKTFKVFNRHAGAIFSRLPTDMLELPCLTLAVG